MEKKMLIKKKFQPKIKLKILIEIKIWSKAHNSFNIN